jgi:hypothetical protein
MNDTDETREAAIKEIVKNYQLDYPDGSFSQNALYAAYDAALAARPDTVGDVPYCSLCGLNHDLMGNCQLPTYRNMTAQPVGDVDAARAFLIAQDWWPFNQAIESDKNIVTTMAAFAASQPSSPPAEWECSQCNEAFPTKGYGEFTCLKCLDEEGDRCRNERPSSPPSGWVATSERLPERGQSVLLTIADTGAVLAGMRSGHGRDCFLVGTANGYAYFQHEHVTAWMPLPAPYQVEDSTRPQEANADGKR